MDDDSNRILNCDATSLLNLKAELYRKQEACKVAKAQQNFGPLKRMVIKGQSIASKKKDKSTPKTTETSEDSYEDEMLQKSRMILEAKAKIYDQIVQKKIDLDEEFSDNYLVDFQRKELFQRDADNKESELKSDHIDDACDAEKEVVSHEDSVSLENLGSPSVSANDQYLDVAAHDFNTSEPLEKTETVDNQTEADGPIHYQNVQFNEIRDHGVAYFGFSEKEKERQEQMDLLKTLRQETIESKQMKAKMKQKKQASLESRLAKVCQRRNIDSTVLQRYTKKEEENEQKVEPEEISDNPSAHSSSTEPASDVSPSSSSKKIRPWDIGKSNLDFPIQASKNKKSGAEKWFEHKREERNEEFAPPSFYFNSQEPRAKKVCHDK